MRNIYISVPITIIFILALVLLLSGIYIGWFNHLVYDDFGRSINDGKSIFENFKLWYFHHNGRFTNAFLAGHHFLYKTDVYRILHIVIIFIWMFSIYFFYKQYLILFIEKNIYAAIILTAITFITMTIGAPELSEWWFWYASSSVYMLGSTFYLLGLGFLLIGIRQNQIKNLLISAAFFFLACGSHELLAMTSVSTTILVYILIKSQKLLIPVFLSLIGFISLAFSPGATSRLKIVSGGDLNGLIGQITLNYLGNTYETLLNGFLYWSSNNLWWLHFALTLSLLCLLSPPKKHKASIKLFLLSLTISISTLFCSALLPVLLNWKVNINDPTRLTNLVYLFFILILTTLAIQASTIANRYLVKNRTAYQLAKTLPALIGIFLLAEISAQKNTLNLIDDIRLEKPKRQLKIIDSWRNNIQNNTSDPVIYLPGLIPSHILVIDKYKPTLDKNNRFNRMWAKHLGTKKGQKIIKRNFDHDLLLAIESNPKKLKNHYDLHTFKDDLRHYLLININRSKLTKDKLCITLISEQNFNLTIRDESFENLNFSWNNNKLCTDFVSRKVFCEVYDLNMVCRIPLPYKFKGKIETKWIEETKVINTL